MGAAPERSFGSVVRDIGGNVGRIVRAELRFVIAELRVAMAAAGGAALLILAGVACATLAAAFLLLGSMFALAIVMPTWLAALVVATVAGTAAVVLLVTGRERLSHPLASQSRDIVFQPEPVE